jgi:O-antigen/teichoic acid export membrane protein
MTLKRQPECFARWTTAHREPSRLARALRAPTATSRSGTSLVRRGPFGLPVAAPVAGVPAGRRRGYTCRRDGSATAHQSTQATDSRRMTTGRRTLSQEVWSGTLWNTLLLPLRLVVGLVASVVFYGRLSLEQVAVVFLLTNLGTTLGVFSDLGIEKALPRFLPEIHSRSGRAGVQAFMRWVMRVRLLALLVPLAALALLAQPICRYLASERVQEAARIEGRLAELRDASPTEIRALQKDALAARTMAGQLNSRGSAFMAVIAAIVVCGAFFDVSMQFLSAFFKRKAWNLISLATTLLQPVLVTTMVVLGRGILGVLAAMLIAPVLSAILAARQARRTAAALPSAGADEPLDRSLFRRFAEYSGVSYLMLLTTWFYDIQFVVLLTGATQSLEHVALLGFAYKFAKDCMLQVWTPLNGVLWPLLAHVKVRNSEAALEDAQASVTRVIWLLLVPAAVGLTLFTPEILRLLYPRYTQAGALIGIFAVAVFGEVLLTVPQNVLMICERYGVVTAARLVGLVSVPLVYVLLPRYGLVGVALAVTVARLGSQLVTLVYASRRMGLSFPLGFATRVLTASACCAALLSWLMRAAPVAVPAVGKLDRMLSLLPLAAWAALGALTFVVALRLLGGVHADERRRLLALDLPFKRVLGLVL